MRGTQCKQNGNSNKIYAEKKKKKLKMLNQLHSFRIANYQLNIVVVFVIETIVLDNFSQLKKKN